MRSLVCFNKVFSSRNGRVLFKVCFSIKAFFIFSKFQSTSGLDFFLLVDKIQYLGLNLCSQYNWDFK